eukprot:g9781.t2
MLKRHPRVSGFQTAVTGKSTFSEAEPQFVDWNSDSEIDLIVAGNQQIQYFERRNGELNEVLDPGLGNVTVGNLDHYRLAAVDWDQDGDVDLLMTTDEGQIKYFERSGGSLVELTNHSFLHINATPPWHYSSWAYMPEIHCLQPVVADWDGDGDLDLLLAPAGLYFERLADGSLVEILQNPFADAVIENPAEQGGMGWKYVTWRAVDCNGDGALDLLRIHSDASQEGFSNYFARSAKCSHCEGYFLQAIPDEQHTTCQPSARSWSMSSVFFVSLLVLFQLLIYTFRYHLSIVDISPMSGQMILTVQQAHHLRAWRKLRPKIIMANTGAPQFDEAERLYEVGSWGSDQLLLFHPADDHVDPNAQTSIGDVRVNFPGTLVHVHAFQIPLLVWLLLFAGGTFASAFYLTFDGIFIITGLSLLSCLALNIAWRYLRPSHPLAKKHAQFLQLRANVSACGRGPTRALQAQQLQDFRDFFQSFIKDRSMYYVCENLVKPLTKEVRLSYAELVGAHQVQWFISHFWGTSFQHFTEAVLKHGISSCQGTSMIVDELALPLQRAWCLFEVLQTQLRATTETASAFEGLILCTSTGVLRNGQGGVDVAMAIARQLAQLDLRDAQASAESDRLMIYALVEQMPGGFDAVNGFVRSSIRDSLLTMHQRFEEDFAQVLQTLQASRDGTLPEERLPMLLGHTAMSRSAANSLCYSFLVGQLLIAGLGVADGYHRRPDLTAEKFVSLPGAVRAFQSGDLVRVTGNVLQCLGRMDHQVKIRGFRLELGEVETVLERHPEVDAAVALLLDCDEGPELCAFVTKKSQATRATERGALRGALRRHVAEALPSYARPQRLAESFPLLPSGKVDRRSLQQGPRPPPLAEAAEGTIHESLDEIDWQSPSHEEEAALRQAVADLLAMVTGVVLEDTEPLGALGIDSMSAIPLAELLSAQLLQNAELPLEDLYVYNTLQSLCGYLKGRLAEMPKKPPGGGGTSTKKSGKTSGKASYAELKKSRQPKGETDGTKTAKMVPGLEACRAGDVAKLKELLLDGSFHVTTLDRFGGSGLHWAASAGHLEVCHLLVKHQALISPIACSLDALQRRARAQAEDLTLLCSRAASICRSGDDGAGKLQLSQLRTLLAVANSTLQALCEASARLLQQRGVKLPPAPDVGCYQNVQGEDVCDVDLSAETIRVLQLSQDEMGDNGGVERKRLTKHRPVRWQNPFQYNFQTEVQTYTSELALRILYMFHVYPRAFNTFQAAKDAQPSDWHDRLAWFNLMARVFIVNAIRNLRLHKTQHELAKWFGRAALGENLEDTRRELLRVLNSAVHVMDSAEFIYNTSECDENTFAFVFPSGSNGVPDLVDTFRKNQKGQYVVYVCPLTVYAEKLGLLPDAVQTMESQPASFGTQVHESTHHEFAYSDDVYMCARSHYLWLSVDGLINLNGSACSGSLKPRFSVGGLSCNVPGREILRLSNWTRQPFAVGMYKHSECPANMANLKTEESTEDFPNGCYHIDVGPFQGVYFNTGPGSPSESAKMLCATLPTKVASNDQMVHVVKVSQCLEAGDIFELNYGGHIASKEKPYGCFKDLDTQRMTFNILYGTPHPKASLVCRQPFSFDVLDHRLMYSMTVLRFAQDGDAALFSIADTTFSPSDCEMAYGKSNCKALAKQDPAKALLNADSFGYYVIDAGAPSLS